LLKDLLHVIRPLGILLMAFSAAFLPPIGVSLYFDEGALPAFVAGASVNFAAGFVMWGLGRRHRRELKSRDGFLLVALIWMLLAATATVPMVVGLGMSFTDAYFETVSGLTTTGATVITGLDHIPHAHNLWRHELTWLGGLGIIGLAMAVLPLLGVGGMQVYRAEATGPIKDSKLTPRFVQTARSIWMIYFGLTVACILAFHVGGMRWFDAVCHAFSVMSLGGFSTHDASMGHFDSPLLEALAVLFMLLAGINFATHFVCWRARSLKPYVRDAEIRTMLLLVLGSCVAMSVWLVAVDVYPDWPSALRHSVFNIVSVGLTCGLASTDYGQWPIFASVWMLALSCVLSAAGSTGGGIKMIRLLILFKQSARELMSLVHPSAVSTLKVGGQVISDRTALSVFGFIHLYTMSVVSLSFALTISGVDLSTAFGAVIASINNTGPALGIVGPAGTYQPLTDFQTWICTVAMLVGRLEVFVLIVLLTPTFWKE
jgi:trk system potassium uptake protein TrkH